MMDPPNHRHHSKALLLQGDLWLTLQQESLRVTGGSPSEENTEWSCCGLLSTKDTGRKNIDYYSILNAYISSDKLTITYIDGKATKNAPVNALQYSLPAGQELREEASSWTKELLKFAYGPAQQNKRLKVLINPFCSSAQTKLHTFAAPIFDAAHCAVDIEETKYRGHASEIAEKIDLNAYDAIVCCSGDGLPYEVFNGLARRKDACEALSSIAVTMIPCGSGNAMAWNVFGTDDVSLCALGIVKGVEMPLDLASITQGDRHTLSFLSQALGVLADCDLKTEHLRWMGDSRFLYGVLATLARNTKYPSELAFSPSTGAIGSQIPRAEKDSGKRSRGGLSGLPLKYGTILDDVPSDWEIMPRERLASFYTGNMKIVAKDTNFFPDALPNDGFLDVMMVDDTIGWAGALEAIIKLPQGRCHELKAVEMRKTSAFRLTPCKPSGDISVDGERYPFEAFQVEVHQGLGRVLAKSKDSYQVQDE